MSRISRDNGSSPRAAPVSRQPHGNPQHAGTLIKPGKARQITEDFLRRVRELLGRSWMPSFPIDINTGLPPFSITISTQKHHTAFFGSARDPRQGYFPMINRRLGPALKLKYVLYREEGYSIVWVELRERQYKRGYDLTNILDAAAKIRDGLKEWAGATDHGGRLAPIIDWGGDLIEEIIKTVSYPPALLNAPKDEVRPLNRRLEFQNQSNWRGSATNRRAVSVSLPDASSMSSRGQTFHIRASSTNFPQAPSISPRERASHTRASSSNFPEVHSGRAYMDNNRRARRIPDSEDTGHEGDIKMEGTEDRETDGEGDVAMKDLWDVQYREVLSDEDDL
ncbi:hypothetical protein BDZ45DRAFT_482420 [Acephala macrosclerotiorum]|nr:hypothetical protein BDZ45DRAFT_482420 [Acephala macrosclerotiorum]